MSPLNPASLVESSQHSRATLELLNLKIDNSLIDYIVQITVSAVAHAFYGETGDQSVPSLDEHASFRKFASNVITRSEVTVGVLLVALVYIERAQPHLDIQTLKWAHERVFLGALVLASKYTNDWPMINIQWASVTGVFGKGDIGRIEREFLDVLDYELGVSEFDILDHHESLMALQPPSYETILSPRVIRRVPSLANSEDSSSSSDSDVSSADSAPSPVTPPTPAHHRVFTKTRVHYEDISSKPLHLSPPFSGPQIPSPRMESEIQVAA